MSGIRPGFYWEPAVVTLRNTSVPRWRWQTAAAALVAIASIFLFVPAFSYMLVERELHHVDWPFAPEKPRTSYQAASASLAFLVVADEGDARINIPTLDGGRGS
jgi:hypothetical protein